MKKADPVYTADVRRFIRHPGLLLLLFVVACSAAPTRFPVPLDELPPVADGNLPGITFADDIHPIFVERKCLDCHSGLDPFTMPDGEAFALSLDNPRIAWRELVPSSKPIRPGESLPDGRSRWPTTAEPEDRWRVRPGEPDASSLMRKLEWDYDGAFPGMPLEEAQLAPWGHPMPYQEDGRLPEGDRNRIRNWIAGLVSLEAPTQVTVRVLGPDGRPFPALVEFFLDWDGRLPADRLGREYFPTDEQGEVQLHLPPGAVVSRTLTVRIRQARGGLARVVSHDLKPGDATTFEVRFGADEMTN